MFLPGVSIEAILEATGEVVAQTSSNDQGQFELSGLPAGILRFRASLAGFADRIIEAVAIGEGDELEIHFELEVAGIDETVEVRESVDEGIPRNSSDWKLGGNDQRRSHQCGPPARR